MGSFQMAWSNVIPFDRLVVGPRGAGAVTALKLNIASEMPETQRRTPSRLRVLIKPDVDDDFFFMAGLSNFSCCFSDWWTRSAACNLFQDVSVHWAPSFFLWVCYDSKTASVMDVPRQRKSEFFVV
jgi:hypothetical protein